MAITFAAPTHPVVGYVEQNATALGSYVTGGLPVTAANFGLSRLSRLVAILSGGYICQPIISVGGATALLKILDVGALSAGGTNAASAVTGTAAAQTFTGVASTSGEVTAFNGTGQSSAGQVITTTDNQTMTLNQCAGMWFISATHGPFYIVSNTAVMDAPAVLTVIGTAPTTDAGAYIIAKSPTPAGTNGTSAVTGTAAAQVFTPSATSEGPLVEVVNGVNLASITAVFQAYGY